MTKRTLQQNKAIHRYFKLLAESLDGAGLDMRAVLKPEVDIPWTQESVKNHLWKPIQDIVVDKESTADLDTPQVDEIYRVLSRHLSEKFGVYVPFPDRSGE